MIASMTAFGRTEIEGSGYRVTLEMRTLNSRYLDVVLRFPKNFLEFEEMFRRRIARSIRRGRIEVHVQIETVHEDQKAPGISIPLARSYWEQLQSLHQQIPGSDPPKLEHLMRIPHIYEAKEDQGDRDAIKGILKDALEEALGKVQSMRMQEGESLLQDIIHRLTLLREDLKGIRDRKDTFLQEYQQRLRDRIQELMGTPEVEEARLCQEIAFFAERSDITEETVRIESHLDRMLTLVKDTQPADGRTLDFITQELHREVNTIGCKAGDLPVTQAVVRMKGEIGKLREQVQNIE